MTSLNNTLTQSQLKEILHYDPLTGLFTWIIRKCGVSFGEEVGCYDAYGYRRTKIDGVFYKVHRLAFLYMEGSLPPDQVDHINHVRDDNRWCNLRKATHKENQKNKSKSSSNKSGVTGVHWHGSNQKWRVVINGYSSVFQLGEYDDFFEAVCVRKSAEVDFGYHKNHGD